MGRDYRAESWWPQPLLDRWYLTDSDSFEIPTKSVGEAEKSRLQKIDSLGSGACLNLWDLLLHHKVQVLCRQNWKFFTSCVALLLRMGTKPQRSGLALYLFSGGVIVHINL